MNTFIKQSILKTINIFAKVLAKIIFILKHVPKSLLNVYSITI